MKIYTVLFSLICAVLICGCSIIGNGISTVEKQQLGNIESIEIQGDWHVEIICNAAENAVETVIDSNLRKYIDIDADDELELSLEKSVRAMVLPVARIYLKKEFKELSLSDGTVCKITNFKSAGTLEIELEDKAICNFNNIQAVNIEAELEDFTKLSFKGKSKNLNIKVKDRAVFDADDIENLKLHASNNTICRIGKCTNAFIEAENDASVTFKYVKNIRQATQDNARIDYPVIIPESLKTKKIGTQGFNL